jgi:hypothetical protein
MFVNPCNHWDNYRARADLNPFPVVVAQYWAMSKLRPISLSILFFAVAASWTSDAAALQTLRYSIVSNGRRDAGHF